MSDSACTRPRLPTCQSQHNHNTAGPESHNSQPSLAVPHVCRDPVADMQYCPRQDTLFALHGAAEMLPSPANTPRAYLQKWDAVSGVAIAGASEFMEDWNLKCFCVTDQHSGGNEVIAGAVSGKAAIWTAMWD